MISGKEGLSDEKITTSLFISGHVSNYPNLLVNDLKTFCILRNPVDRYISHFLYFSDKFDSISLDEAGLEKWMYSDAHGEKHCNIQAKSLTGTVDSSMWNISDSDTKVRNNWFYTDYNLSENAIKDSIDRKVCSSLEKRDIILNQIKDIFYKNYGVMPFHNDHKVNINGKPRFDISKNIRSAIESMNEADMVAYEYVKSKESKVSV